MDRERLLEHLAKAEHAAAQGERHLEHQRGVIEKLREGGHDTCRAQEILRTFEESQELHLADVARIRKELAQAK